jgi:hypothetical protein
VQLPPGTGSFHPVAIETAAEATKLSDTFIHDPRLYVLFKGSLQPRILRLGLLQDGDFGIGVFPEGEEILVGGESTDPKVVRDQGARPLSTRSVV